MSRYEHDLLTTRFAALAPRPLPGDWNDVIDRGAAHPPRSHLAQSLWRGRRGRKLVVALAVAVLVAAVAGAAYGTVRVLFLDKGFIGLPPVGATPSAPESGELVVQWLGRSATHARPNWRGGYVAPLVRVWVYTDGRIVWSREGTSGYLEQRLTPEGVDLLRAEVVGLLDRSRVPLDTFPVDHELGVFGGSALFGHDLSAWGSVEVRDDNRFVRLQWHGIGAERGSKRFREILRDLRKRFDGTVATEEQVSVVRRIDALLTNPTSVLPSSAWAEPKVRAYVPSHYAVCIDTSPPTGAPQLLALLPTQAADVLRDQRRTRRLGEVVEAREGGRTVVLGRSVTYCSKLATEDAREVADALASSGFDEDPRFHRVVLAYRLAEPVSKSLNPTSISFEPYFPHGEVTCSACG